MSKIFPSMHSKPAKFTFFALIPCWIVVFFLIPINLPLLGTGVVLIPWAVVSFFIGDMRLGMGLLILFGVSSLVRQFTEPRLLGAELGLHPLVSLLAVYAGWKLFGVWGMMLAPFGALWAKALIRKKGEAGQDG